MVFPKKTHKTGKRFLGSPAKGLEEEKKKEKET